MEADTLRPFPLYGVEDRWPCDRRRYSRYKRLSAYVVWLRDDI
jgi:hypothetical protein